MSVRAVQPSGSVTQENEERVDDGAMRSQANKTEEVVQRLNEESSDSEDDNDLTFALFVAAAVINPEGAGRLLKDMIGPTAQRTQTAVLGADGSGNVVERLGQQMSNVPQPASEKSWTPLKRQRTENS